MDDSVWLEALMNCWSEALWYCPRCKGIAPGRRRPRFEAVPLKRYFACEICGGYFAPTKCTVFYRMRERFIVWAYAVYVDTARYQGRKVDLNVAAMSAGVTSKTFSRLRKLGPFRREDGEITVFTEEPDRDKMAIRKIGPIGIKLSMDSGHVWKL